MIDIGITKIRKEGMQYINMSRTEKTLTRWLTIKSVISSILAIRKIRVNKSRLMINRGMISLKIYLLVTVLSFICFYTLEIAFYNKTELR